MIRTLIRKHWRRPSSYVADPWGYAKNQIGHGWLIGAGSAWLLSPTLGHGTVPIVVVAYAVLIELPQLRRFGAQVWDSVEDWAHVAACALAVTAAWEAGAVQLAFLMSGILRRVEERRLAG